MKRDFLEGLGIDKETVEKIIAEHGKTIERIKVSGETLKQENEALKTQIDEANNQIEGFKSMNIEGIKRAAEDYKIKYEKAEADAQSKIEKLQFDYALNGALSEAKAKDLKAAKALLDIEKLKYTDGEIVGLSEQLEKLKKEKDFLFDIESETKILNTGAMHTGVVDNVDSFILSARKAAGLTEQSS